MAMAAPPIMRPKPSARFLSHCALTSLVRSGILEACLNMLLYLKAKTIRSSAPMMLTAMPMYMIESISVSYLLKFRKFRLIKFRKLKKLR